MITFPRVGSEKTVPLYQPPTRDEKDSDADFALRQAWYEERKGVTVTVRLLPRETVRKWAFEFGAALTADQRRMKATGIESPLGLTAEGAAELNKLHAEVLRACLVRIEGVAVGDEDLSLMGDRERLIAMLDEVDMLGPAAMAARQAQSPTPAQKN